MRDNHYTALQRVQEKVFFLQNCIKIWKSEIDGCIYKLSEVSNNINPFFCVSVDTVSNHVKPYWPTEAITASDSEDPGGAERLRVETKVSVELHQENKLNHTGETTQDKDHPTASIQANSNHQPEQRKGES